MTVYHSQLIQVGEITGRCRCGTFNMFVVMGQHGEAERRKECPACGAVLVAAFRLERVEKDETLERIETEMVHRIVEQEQVS